KLTADCFQVTVARVALQVFFFQAEDGIRDRTVTGVQTCALPIFFVGTGLRSYWWLLLLFVTASIWLFRRRLRRPAVRFRWDQRLLRWPLIGDLVAKVEVARFARTLATLLANGVTLLSGLSIVKETMTNTVLATALDGVVTRLREGK